MTKISPLEGLQGRKKEFLPWDLKGELLPWSSQRAGPSKNLNFLRVFAGSDPASLDPAKDSAKYSEPERWGAGVEYHLMSPTPRRKWYLTTGRRAYLRNEKKNCQKEMHFMFQIGPKLPLYILIYIYTNETYIYSRLLRIGCIQVDILKSQRYTY